MSLLVGTVPSYGEAVDVNAIYDFEKDDGDACAAGIEPKTPTDLRKPLNVHMIACWTGIWGDCGGWPA